MGRQRQFLLGVVKEGPILDERSTRVLREHAVAEQAGALLHDLAAATEGRHQMTLTAARRIEDRAQAVGRGFRTGELLLGGLEVALVCRDLRRVGRAGQGVLIVAELGDKTVSGLEATWGIDDSAL
jgi:hypothetical protein